MDGCRGLRDPGRQHRRPWTGNRSSDGGGNPAFARQPTRSAGCRRPRRATSPGARREGAGVSPRGGGRAPFTNAKRLGAFNAVVFLTGGGDVLDPEQEAGLEAYLEAGGGFLGIHDAARTEPYSDWFTGLIGARPAANSPAAVQRATVEVPDRVNPATRNLPVEWKRPDKWLNWASNPTGKVHTVAKVRENSYQPGAGANGVDHPVSWCRDYDGGRSFYTGMGGTAESFAETDFRDHLRGALQWTTRLSRADCKATIDANYSAVKVTHPNQPGQQDQIGEPHGLVVAPDGRVLYIGRGGGANGAPVVTDWNSPDMGKDTLTFDVSDPEYNHDVPLNILANPGDDNGGRHIAEVTLTPGRYRYFCSIPGHGQMQGILTVTEAGGEDTTAPTTAAEVTGQKNADGAYVGSATVTVTATDDASGVKTVEYAVGEDGPWQPYTTPVVVDQIGSHTVRYRATDQAGSVAAEKSVVFDVVAPPTDDTTAPETSATVSGEKDADGDYLTMATVTVTASDTGSGVNTIEYAIGAGGAWQPYTAPVMVHQLGSHTVRYRATDQAGNAAAEKSVAFTVVAPPTPDTAAPETSATVTGTKNSGGAYITSAKVTVTATDADSGVDRIEYSLDGGPYLAYTAPVVVDRIGYHTLAYRATDQAGNTSTAAEVTFTIAQGGGVPAPNCPEYDERLTVIVGTVDSGVPNRLTRSRCTINELIEDEKDWSSHALFLKHVDGLLDKLLADNVIDQREFNKITKAAKQSKIGKPGQTKGYRDLFDGTEASLAKWEQVGGGRFTLSGEGAITSSTTVPGMGMLWFPERKYGDFSLKFQFRDDAPGTGNANGGVFIRFPNVHDHPEESRPEWVAINYGHELQILDRPDGDMYKTGSVYGFDRVGLGGAGVTPKGTWNDYEIRAEGQHFTILRNGVVINEFDNVGGQGFTPPRAGDPGTDGRRYDTGYIGLQVHSTTDVISYRDIRVKEL